RLQEQKPTSILIPFHLLQILPEVYFHFRRDFLLQLLNLLINLYQMKRYNFVTEYHHQSFWFSTFYLILKLQNFVFLLEKTNPLSHPPIINNSSQEKNSY